MNSFGLLEALGSIDDIYIEEARSKIKDDVTERKLTTKKVFKRNTILAAAIITLMTLCGLGFAAGVILPYPGRVIDQYSQTPNENYLETVKSTLENEIANDYTLELRIDEIVVDEKETIRMAEMYKGSELAESRGWSDSYLEDHFIAVFVKYYAVYDNSKTPLDSGINTYYYYLVEDVENDLWIVVDSMHIDTIR